MKISVVIPIYNVQQFIVRCLKSVLAQTYDNLEIILVNDATPDDSMTVIEDVIQNTSRKNNIKIINHPINKGLAAARNSGVKEATGDYIFFLDSDDEISPNCIELLASLAIDKTIDMVIGEIEVIGNKRNAYPLLQLKDGIYRGNNFILNAFLQRKWYEMAWNKLIKTSLFIEKNVWFTEGILHEDTLWSFQLAMHLQSLAVLNAKTYYYHIQSNSITQKKTQKNIEDSYFLIREIAEEANASRLFIKAPSVAKYLESQRIYFIKNLYRNNLPKQFIEKQKLQLDNLYKQYVWPNKPQTLLSKVKEWGIKFIQETSASYV
ncbi:glycosyltransferase involved in cell wall biosynthesis [Dysgonomonadaceae bacterium PH5-43]|nr:glycosyltransferase involved in cell wall biosynthesis [Dysgonomonadaceae bacterium PH5-43]